ncbi:hypothetical protein EIO60_03641|nr:hypothetical protein [Candidatus Pantoea persica]
MGDAKSPFFCSLFYLAINLCAKAAGLHKGGAIALPSSATHHVESKPFCAMVSSSRY